MSTVGKVVRTHIAHILVQFAVGTDVT